MARDDKHKMHSEQLIDLGDVRIATHGYQIFGPLEVQTLTKTYDAGIQTDD